MSGSMLTWMHSIRYFYMSKSMQSSLITRSLIWLSLQIWRSSIMLFFSIAPNMKEFWTPVLDSQPCSPALPGLVLASLIFPPVGAWLLFIYYHEKVLCVNSRLVLKTIAFSFLAIGWAIFGIIVIEFALLSVLLYS